VDVIHPQDDVALLAVAAKTTLAAKEAEKKPSIKVAHVT
jgi:DNA-binding XRE family transcriptional regulator